MTTDNKRKQLLLAIRQIDVAGTQAILGSGFNPVFCHTYEAAEAVLSSDIAAVVCGVHFDKGAVFNLLRRVRSDPTIGRIPFFVMLDAGNRYNYSPAIIHGLRAAAMALGATEFTDLGALVERYGKVEAVRIMRERVAEAFRESCA